MVPQQKWGIDYGWLVDVMRSVKLKFISLNTDLGESLDSKSAEKELKAVTPEKSKSCVTAFTKKLVTTFQLSRTRSGHISLK